MINTKNYLQCKIIRNHIDFEKKNRGKIDFLMKPETEKIYFE